MEKKTKELKKVQILAPAYYLRKDIQKVIFEFCKNRETIPRYLEGFGKRPDCFDYPNDIGAMARKGATSFHCSEELWENPLDINTNMTPEQYNEIKIGWDFLIDIDSKYLDYSKLAAKILIEELEHHGIKNYGIKFSGSKGFHIIVPFKSFPKKVGNVLTKDKFPEWARLIASYLFGRIKNKMDKEILDMTNEEELKTKGELTSEHLCPNCGNITERKIVGLYLCQDLKCRTKVESMKSNRQEMICPSCNGKMKRISEREIDFCKQCNINTAKLESIDKAQINKDIEKELGKKSDLRKEDIEKNHHSIKQNHTNFEVKKIIKSTQDSIDIVLVSSRHLFRAPYSLHEKTALASIVIKKEDLDNFTLSDADPLKINEPKDFMPEVKEGEAKDLLLQALDEIEKKEEIKKKYEGATIDLKGIIITEEMFPPIIKKLLKGIKDDGRKRALYILLSFYNSLDFPQDYIIEKIEEWNKKNYHPLKEGYLKSQYVWFEQRKPLPPNYDKPIYKEFGINSPPEPGIKNPINYTIKLALREKGKNERSYPKK